MKRVLIVSACLMSNGLFGMGAGEVPKMPALVTEQIADEAIRAHPIIRYVIQEWFKHPIFQRFINDFYGVFALECDTANSFYAYTRGEPVGINQFRINTSTGQVTFIENVGITHPRSLEFASKRSY